MNSVSLAAAVRIGVLLTMSSSLTAVGHAAAAAKDGASPLQVQVRIPASWQPMFDDEVEEAFVSRVRDIFDRRGFSGKIKYVSDFDEPSPGCCLLTINLIDWRLNHIGNVDCTFTASIQTDRTSRNLGIYSQSAFRWLNGASRFGLAETFDDAAEGAIRQLYDRLAKTELVPGLRRS